VTELAANPVYLNPAEQAEALALALNALGFSTRVHKARQFMYHPCVVIHCGPTRHVKEPEYVYCAPEPSGDYWFFWRVDPGDKLRVEKIAPIAQVSNTADLLARTIPQLEETGNARQPES
jgi:hypothetical protein